MTTDSTRSPVTRETSAFVRDKGMRPVLATLSGGVLILRAKGLRSRETLDIGWCYQQAVKQRVNQERAERGAANLPGAIVAFALALGAAFLLGALGPSLDAGPSYSSYGYVPPPPLDAGEVDQLEAEARRKCATHPQDNGGVILHAHGAVVCTDKRGRAR